MNKYNRIIGIIQLMRPQSVFLMLLFIYVPIIIHTSDYSYSILQVFPLYMLLTAEIILNDYMDIDKDKINKPHRPLAAGKVDCSLARKLMIGFLSGALISSFFIYRTAPKRFFLFITVFVILTLYSLFPRIMAPIKAFITAFVTFLCLCFIFTFIDPTHNLIFYAFSAFFYISSREVLMDIRDYKGDSQYQCKTLAVRLGTSKAYWLAVILMTISQSLFFNQIIIRSSIQAATLWLISFIIIVLLFLRFKSAAPQTQNKIALLLWIPMLLSIPCVI